ncbi:hypothetical protein M3223_14390 [Paenibacillus pasadenensis]|nr:hypothetical protein [Paenibacillus pasadenensis]
MISHLLELKVKHSDPVDFMRTFVLNLADTIDTSLSECIIPFGFWVSSETSAVSDTMRDACLDAFGMFKQTIAGKFAESGIAQERTDEIAELLIYLIEGAIIMTNVERQSRALRRVAENLPLIFRE